MVQIWKATENVLIVDKPVRKDETKPLRNEVLEYVIDTQKCCGDISQKARETNRECAESQRN